VGFNASAMKEASWTVVVDGEGAISEHRLADQGAAPTSTPLAPTVKVVSTHVTGGVRTVVLSRPLKSPYLSFEGAAGSMSFINAVGTGPKLAFHKNKAPSALVLLPEAGKSIAGDCVCPTKPVPFGQAKGTLEYVPVESQKVDVGSGTVSFGNNCAPQPRSDLLAQKNPTCDLRTYVGGQIACHHMWSLLDADQEIPWQDQPLEYVLKWRFWVQEYDASYHQNVKRTTWGIASPVEYDVPKCDASVPGCEQTVDGNWVHTITGTFEGKGKLVAAHFHCHAPTCLSVTMYDNKTGAVICREDPIYGGATGSGPGFDEPGFIAQPPCLWGSPDQGLEEPLDLGEGTTLHVVKTANATSGHHGEMAWLQMLYY